MEEYFRLSRLRIKDLRQNIWLSIVIMKSSLLFVSVCRHYVLYVLLLWGYLSVFESLKWRVRDKTSFNLLNVKTEFDSWDRWRRTGYHRCPTPLPSVREGNLRVSGFSFRVVRWFWRPRYRGSLWSHLRSPRCHSRGLPTTSFTPSCRSPLRRVPWPLQVPCPRVRESLTFPPVWGPIESFRASFAP